MLFRSYSSRLWRLRNGESVRDIILDDEQTYDTETAQVAITAIQIALTDYLATLGATPAAVVGMSIGCGPGLLQS